MLSGQTAPREPARSGDEQDVITRWRRVYCWTHRAGACHRVKRQLNRRARRRRDYLQELP
jgi:hypothetical protein